MGLVGVNGTSLFVRDEGTGPVALFVHGYPLDHTLWLDQIASLSGERRCVAPDLRGYGGSAADASPSLTMELLAADLEALIRQLDSGPVDLIGLSMGGYVALALWESAPGLIRSLTLANTRSGADSEAGRAKRDASIAGVIADGRQALSSAMVGGLLGPSPSVDATARLRTMVEGTRYETIVATLRGMRDREDRTSILSTITVPTLVVGSSDDNVIPAEDIAALADGIADSRTVIIDGAGHLPPIEQPEAMTRALGEFLAGL